MEIYKKLETEFAKFAGKKYAVAVNSGTAALHLALLAMGVGKGDEVIVPDLTFVACAFAVTYTGAKPIFVDCDDTLNMNPNLIEAKITKRTKVIMAVHLYGRKCDMKKIMAIAKRHNLKVLEDVSEAHGIKLSNSEVAIYSLQNSKIINSQEGGILVTNNKKIVEKVVHMKGLSNDGRYFHDVIGFNYRMPNATAELALKSLREFPKNSKKRMEEAIARDYDCDAAWVTVLICRSEKIRDLCIKENPKCRCLFKPMTTLPMYRGQKVGKKAFHFSKVGLVIPIVV